MPNSQIKSLTVGGVTYDIVDETSGYITGMTILSYGHSTWSDFTAAYNANQVVYCRASSNSDPGSGSQTRLAFMAYVDNATTPTNVEFQYYRSMSSHSITQLGDQVYVYKLTNAGTWSVTTRNASEKEIVVSGSLTRSWSNDVLTLTGTDTNYIPTGGTTGQVLAKKTDTNYDLEWITAGSGSGTVTSVAVSNDTNGGLSVSGSPITSSGTITIGHSNVLTNAQTTSAVYPIKIDKNGHISEYGSAVTIPSITLNGSSTTSPSFYAPTSAGTNGYYLKSNGSGAPTWTSLNAVPKTVGDLSRHGSTITSTSTAITITQGNDADPDSIIQLGSSGISLSVIGLAGTNSMSLTPTSTTIHNVVSPTNDGDAANKKYVDDSVGALTIPTITLNGSSTTSPSFYAPTTVGTSGYYLKSNGSGAPTWAALPSGGVSDVTVGGTSVVSSGVAAVPAIPTKVSDLTNDSGFVTTDEKVSTAAVTSGTTYYLTVGTNTTSAETKYYDSKGLKYTSTQGNSNQSGSAVLTLGQSANAGSANGRYGTLEIYSELGKKASIYPQATLNSDRTYALPNKSGTVALTSDIPTVPTSAGSATTGITVADHSSTTIYGVQSSTTSVTGVQSSTTTASKVTLGTAISVPNVTAAGSGSFTQGSFSGGSFTQGTDSFTPNSPTVINTSAFGGGSFTRGSFSGGSGSFTQGSFSGGSLTMSRDSTDTKKLNITFTAATHGADSHTHTAATHGADSFTPASLGESFYQAGTAASFTQGEDSFTPATHGSDSHTHTPPTLGTAKSIPNVTGVSDVTVPIKNTSATTVPIKNSSTTTVITSKTHTVTDNGHTHSLS